jgi:hypothetical protein
MHESWNVLKKKSSIFDIYHMYKTAKFSEGRLPYLV